MRFLDFSFPSPLGPGVVGVCNLQRLSPLENNQQNCINVPRYKANGMSFEKDHCAKQIVLSHTKSDFASPQCCNVNHKIQLFVCCRHVRC